MKQTPLRRQSPKQARLQAEFHSLCDLLTNERAFLRCENPFCGEWRNLIGHHIQKRSEGRIDTPENIIMLCDFCHDHDKYPHTGMAMSVEEAKEIVRAANEKYGIEAKWAEQ